MGQTTPKTASFPWGSKPHLIHCSLDPPETATKMASWLVRTFCRAHKCVQQTDRHTHTDQPCYSIHSNSLNLMQCMWHRLKIKPICLVTFYNICRENKIVSELWGRHSAHGNIKPSNAIKVHFVVCLLCLSVEKNAKLLTANQNMAHYTARKEVNS